ncbi:NAD(P)-dependent oxidoreductase [Nocardia abscessus]|uniref:NAD(P)-dependent oxidoreductase n=1 Tax=Nocardia abscessus TaxID=120957 RepID=UPI0024588B94|nr:NAD(P)-dependent oxidoreductase [Nocardia abscessus]
MTSARWLLLPHMSSRVPDTRCGTVQGEHTMDSEDSQDWPQVLVVGDGYSQANWPFLVPRLTEQLGHHDVAVRSLSVTTGSRLRDLDGVAAAAALVLLDVVPEAQDIAAMSALEVVAGVTDGAPLAVAGVLAERGIPFVDGSRGRDRSRAEMAIGLMQAGLRQIPAWHLMTWQGPSGWPPVSWQVTDNVTLVNGTIHGKAVVVIGSDPVGQQIAQFCSMFGAVVSVVDADAEDAWSPTDWSRRELRNVWSCADIVVSASGPGTPQMSSDMVDLLPTGALVVTVTSHGIDLAALRRRASAGQLAWATDVYDTAPVPIADPLLGRENVVHTPGVAARTCDAMVAIADVLADNIIRVLGGNPPLCWDHIAPPPAETTSAALAVRG